MTKRRGSVKRTTEFLSCILVIIIVVIVRSVTAASLSTAAVTRTGMLSFIHLTIFEITTIIVLAFFSLLLRLLTQLIRIHVRRHHVTSQRTHEFVRYAANVACQNLLVLSLLLFTKQNKNNVKTFFLPIPNLYYLPQKIKKFRNV